MYSDYNNTQGNRGNVDPIVRTMPPHIKIGGIEFDFLSLSRGMGIEAQSGAYAHQAGNLVGAGIDKDGVRRLLKLSTVVAKFPATLLVCGAAVLCMWAHEPAGRLGGSALPI